MKIAYFTDTYFPEVNGIVTSILGISEKLAQRGHKIIIFCPKYHNKKEIQTHRNIRVIRIFAVPLVTYTEVRVAWPNHIKILRELKRFKPDIIHFHTPGPTGASAIICSKVLKIPLIGTFHTLVTEQLDYLSIKNIPAIESLLKMFSYPRKIKELLHNLPKRLSLNKTLFFRRSNEASKKNLTTAKPSYPKQALRNSAMTQQKNNGKQNNWLKQCLAWKILRIMYGFCHLVTTPSPALVKELKKQRIPSNIIYLSNGIDFSMLRRKSKHTNNKRIIFVGRVSYEKNIDVIIKAMAYVLERHPAATFTIVGDGPAQMALKKLAQSLNIEKSIIFTGMIPHDKISGWYDRSDVFATASTMETQGLTILEAMYCGLPIVGVRKYAIPDWVKSEVNGYTTPPYDAKKMAEALIKILDSKERIESFGKKAALTAEEHDLNKIMDQIEEMYKRELKSSLDKIS
jgi:glycosyltransferase involved in cell wall biosynthesis